jgi:hypothetical protein
VSDYIYGKMGANLHLRPDHPLCIIKNAIYAYFDASAPGTYRTFDDLPPVVSATANFDEVLVPSDHVSRSPNDTYYVDPTTVLRCHTSAHQAEMLRNKHAAFLVTGESDSSRGGGVGCGGLQAPAAAAVGAAWCARRFSSTDVMCGSIQAAAAAVGAPWYTVCANTWPTAVLLQQAGFCCMLVTDPTGTQPQAAVAAGRLELITETTPGAPPAPGVEQVVPGVAAAAACATWHSHCWHDGVTFLHPCIHGH